MPRIRIVEKDWGRVWKALVASGPISRSSQELIYHVSEQQVKLLQQKKLPFEVVPTVNGRDQERHA